MLTIGEGTIDGLRMLTRLCRFAGAAALTVALNVGANCQSTQSPGGQQRDSDSRTVGPIVNATSDNV